MSSGSRQRLVLDAAGITSSFVGSRKARTALCSEWLGNQTGRSHGVLGG